jgi:glutathione S-transferase
MIAAAASADTEGWQIATMCERGPSSFMKAIRCSVYSSRPNFPQRNVARIVPVGDIDVVILQQRFHRAAQQRRKVAGHWRHQQHARLRRRICLAEMQQRAERRREHDFLGHLQFLISNQHLVDAVSRARVGRRCPRDQLERCRKPAEQPVGDALRNEAEVFQRRRRARPPWRRQVHVVLIRLISHGHHAVLPAIPVPCNIEASSRPDGLKNWHVACCLKCPRRGQRALARCREAASHVPSGVQGWGKTMAKATLTISSKNYSSWSLRGWLLAKFSGLEFDEIVTSPDDPSAKAEILLLSSSILVPCLRHEGATVWDTLAIAEYLNEVMPDAGLLPADRVARAHCRSICGEIHSGFTTLRASLPVNLKGHFPNFKIWSRAQGDIDRICTIWRECLDKSSGPFLFGERGMADAMYAPVVTRFMTYDVKLDKALMAYAGTVMAMPQMQEWIEAAKAEPADIEELEVEY